MNSKQTIKLTNEFALQYDEHVEKGLWKGPEVLFNELKEYIRPNDKLLDIGIGTGLASLPFYKAGLNIYGIDGSSEMIKLCRHKNFVKQLIQTDITQPEFNLPNANFDFAISNAVFHLIGDILLVISKVAKQLKIGGHLCFTTIPYGYSDDKEYLETIHQGVYYNHKKESDLFVFQHTNSHINYVLEENRLQLIKNQIFLAFTDFQEKRDVFFEYFHTIKRK